MKEVIKMKKGLTIASAIVFALMMLFVAGGCGGAKKAATIPAKKVTTQKPVTLARAVVVDTSNAANEDSQWGLLKLAVKEKMGPDMSSKHEDQVLEVQDVIKKCDTAINTLNYQTATGKEGSEYIGKHMLKWYLDPKENDTFLSGLKRDKYVASTVNVKISSVAFDRGTQKCVASIENQVKVTSATEQYFQKNHVVKGKVYQMKGYAFLVNENSKWKMYGYDIPQLEDVAKSEYEQN
jgi:hypothetical protein